MDSLATMPTPLEMTIISSLVGIVFFMAVLSVLLAPASVLWIVTCDGNADRMAKLSRGPNRQRESIQAEKPSSRSRSTDMNSD